MNHRFVCNGPECGAAVADQSPYGIEVQTFVRMDSRAVVMLCSNPVGHAMKHALAVLAGQAEPIDIERVRCGNCGGPVTVVGGAA